MTRNIIDISQENEYYPEYHKHFLSLRKKWGINDDGNKK